MRKLAAWGVTFVTGLMLSACDALPYAMVFNNTGAPIEVHYATAGRPRANSSREKYLPRSQLTALAGRLV